MRRLSPRLPGATRGMTFTVVAVVLLTPAGHADWAPSSARIDQHAAIRIDAQTITVDYTMTMNRAAAYQEVLAIDGNGDGRMSSAERESYFQSVSRRISAGLELSIDGYEQPLEQVGPVQLSMPFTKRIQYQIAQRRGWQTADLEFHNDNYLAASGDVSIEVIAGGPVEVTYNSLAGGGIDPSTAMRPDWQQRDVSVHYRNASGEANLAGSGAPMRISSAARRSHVLAEAAAAGLGLAITVAALVIARRRRNLDPQERGTIVPNVFSAPTALSGSTCDAYSTKKPLRHGGRSARPLAMAGVLATALLLSARVVTADLDWRFGPALSSVEAISILTDLHRETFEALAARDEDELYETLASSLDGDLLRQTYLEMRRLRVLRDPATKIQFRRVKALQSTVLREGSNMKDRFRVRHRWRAYGIVSHAGHQHARANEYEATFCVSKSEDGWRITAASVQACYRADARGVFATIL